MSRSRRAELRAEELTEGLRRLLVNFNFSSDEVAAAAERLGLDLDAPQDLEVDPYQLFEALQYQPANRPIAWDEVVRRARD